MVAQDSRQRIFLRATGPPAIPSYQKNPNNGIGPGIISMMTSTIAANQGPSPEEDYGLDVVAHHNAAVTSTEQFPVYADDAKGLGIYHDIYAPYYDDTNYLHNPPTPRSNTASEGPRTRSGGHSSRRTDSPFSSGTRVSKSPAPRFRKDRKKSKKSNVPNIDKALSILTKDMSTPLKDMDAWVNRSAEVRRKEVEKRNGYVTRPMNSFMLYRSAYAERTKQWCLQNNHQVVSSVAGESWPMEPQEVRDQFNEWAKIERANHAAAHPEYKFSPSKSTNKRRKDEYTDYEEDVSDLDGDPDSEYRVSGRSVRQRRQGPQQDAASLNSTYGFDSTPYYGQQASVLEQSQHQYVSSGRTFPSRIAYDRNGVPYNPQMGTYIPQAGFQHPRYAYVQEGHSIHVPTPNSLNGTVSHQPSVGGYGIPGGEQMNVEELFATSRPVTPMQHYNQYGQPIYSQYTSTPQPTFQQCMPYQHLPPPPPVSQAYAEHQAYLQAASQPQMVIDPSLEAEIAVATAGQVESHFDSAIGDLTTGDLTGLDYGQDLTSPDGALPSVWTATERN